MMTHTEIPGFEDAGPQYDDFYKKLRKNIEEKLNEWVSKEENPTTRKFLEALIFLPDFFHLAVRLLIDGSVPPKNKGVLLAGIAYVISPVDLIPDVIPGLGWLDDLFVIALALNIFLNTEDEAIKFAVEKHWVGNKDIFETVKHIMEIADSAVDALPKNLMRILKDMFKSR